MDAPAHALWTAAIYIFISRRLASRKLAGKKPANKKSADKKSNPALSTRSAVFWSVFPDLFAFGPLTLILIGGLLSGSFSLSAIGPPRHTGFATLPSAQLTGTLYHLSHSFVIFLLVFAVTYAVLRRPVWELGAWGFHVVIDISTHTDAFYPTPVLWPLSGWTFSGVSWATPWFLVLNYAALLVVYALLWWSKK